MEFAKFAKYDMLFLFSPDRLYSCEINGTIIIQGLFRVERRFQDFIYYPFLYLSKYMVDNIKMVMLRSNTHFHY